MSINQISEASFKEQRSQTWGGAWPLERILFALAGVMTLASVLLATLVSPWVLLLTTFVGVNELLYATAGFCGASLVLRRFTAAKPASVSRAVR